MSPTGRSAQARSSLGLRWPNLVVRPAIRRERYAAGRDALLTCPSLVDCEAHCDRPFLIGGRQPTTAPVKVVLPLRLHASACCPIASADRQFGASRPE